MMIKIGSSACLSGQKVRFDGGHKRLKVLTDVLSEVYEIKTFCPEVGMGMAIPRPTIRLLEKDNQLRLVDSRDVSVDHTEKAEAYANSIKQRLVDLSGFILCAKSPSCGLFRVPVHNEKGEKVHRNGIGTFAAFLKSSFPYLPLEENGRLNDVGLRECFFVKVHAYHDFRENVLHSNSMAELINFHSRYKYLLLAYNPESYKSLGKWVANNDGHNFENMVDTYLRGLMDALSKPARRNRHVNVLMHIQGYFKKSLNKKQKSELSLLISDFHKGFQPLAAPIALLKHYLSEYPNAYLERQMYFQPFPKELSL